MLKGTILSFLMAIALASQAATIRATLTRVFDGDTIEVRDESGRRLRIRLSGIDAPERGQSFGSEARVSLLRVLSAGPLLVEVESADRYHRLLAKVTCAGRDASLAQIASGLAWSYPWADSVSATDRRLYSNEESIARAFRRGLWSEHDPMPPWQYRRQSRRSPYTEKVRPAKRKAGKRLSEIAKESPQRGRRGRRLLPFRRLRGEKSLLVPPNSEKFSPR